MPLHQALVRLPSGHRSKSNAASIDDDETKYWMTERLGFDPEGILIVLTKNGFGSLWASNLLQLCVKLKYQFLVL